MPQRHLMACHIRFEVLCTLSQALATMAVSAGMCKANLVLKHPSCVASGYEAPLDPIYEAGDIVPGQYVVYFSHTSTIEQYRQKALGDSRDFVVLGTLRDGVGYRGLLSAQALAAVRSDENVWLIECDTWASMDNQGLEIEA
jgi:hypothetical protein